MEIIKQLRAKQWVKNLLIFAPLFFSFNLFNKYDLLLATYTFLCFSFLASFVYIINDIKDVEADRVHPVKKNRPIASGKISIKAGLQLAFSALLISILLSILININQLYLILSGYLLLNILYAYILKNISIVNSISIAIGFELRILAGCVVINEKASNFILLVTFFLALLLAFIKRKGELRLLAADSSKHRRVLRFYTINLLNKYISATSTITIIGYLFYTIDDGVIAKVGNDYLKFSLVFVLYGIFRFVQLSEVEIFNKEGDPTTLIYKDRALQISLLLWVLYVTMCLYVF